MKINLPLFILLSLTTACTAQAGSASRDSLFSALEKSSDDTNKVNILIELANSSQDSTGMAFAEKAIALADKLGSSREKIRARFSAGSIYSRNLNQNAITYYNQISSLLKNYNDDNLLAKYYDTMGKYYLHLRENYSLALKNVLEALKLYEKLGDTLNTASCYNMSGMICMSQDNSAQALHYLQIALAMFNGLKDSSSIAYVNNIVAQVYLNEKKYDEAMQHCSAALSIYTALGNRGPAWGTAWTYSYIGNIKMGQGDMAVSEGNMDSASRCFTEAFRIYTQRLKLEHEMLNGRSTDSYIELAKWHLRMFELYGKDFNPAGIARAKDNILSGLQSAMKTNDLSTVSEAYRCLSQVDSLEGNYKDAYKNYRLYIFYRDSIYNSKSSSDIAQMQLKFEFEKDEAIAKVAQDEKDSRQLLIRNSTFAGLAGSFMFLFFLYRQRNRISKEKKRSEDLLLNILPHETAEELKVKGTTDARQFDQVTVMFTDFKNFTQASENLSPADLVKAIHLCYSEFDKIITRHNLEKIKTIGDSYMCAGGLPVANKTNAQDAVAAALEIRAFMEQEKEKCIASGRPFFEIRIGCHTGPVVAGIVGIKKFAYDVWGDTVNIASRMESSGEAGKVNISGETYEMVKEKYKCSYRGKIEAKNKGQIDMYFVDQVV